jgi:hypothetical protein
MRLSSILPSRLVERLHAHRSRSMQEPPHGDNPSKSLFPRLVDVFLRTWDLGFTAFGGPPVHFQILHQRFVEGKGGKEKWVDEQTVRHRYTYSSVHIF